MTQQRAAAFAEEWIAAWNSHDLDRVLSHYSGDFEMSSPFIVQLEGEPTGRLKGRARVGAYWRRALERFPDLKFTLLEVHEGANSVVIRYSNQAGRIACEVFEFDGSGLVSRAAAHYLEPGSSKSE